MPSQVPPHSEPVEMRVGRGNRSSLLLHTFPSFYACYLLKSVQTSTSKATYIGSTPNPPRRIRQHNGELTQGAWKTKRGRPWVMQLIVHGFPSKLAALQWEWAWQHPHLSRHIRDESGSKVFTSTGRSLSQNIQILRFMLSIHPYNLWPLHVKIFTPQALKIWKDLANMEKTAKGKGKEKANTIRSTALPPGFTYSVELEGVDGKLAGGSGRTKPIDVQDEKFTTAYLKKDLDLLASKIHVKCTICQEPLTGYSSACFFLIPLHIPSALITPVMQHPIFYVSQSISFPNGDSDSPLIPRGGSCPSCSNYVLWGDVVKGCYRRSAGGAVSVEEDEEALDNMYDSDSLAEEPNASKGKRKAKRTISPRKKREIQSQLERSSSSLGENFDFQEVEEQRYSDDLGLTVPTPLTPSNTRARKPKADSSSPTPKKRSKAVQAQDSSDDELFVSDSDAPKRKVGRPRKQLAVEEAVSSKRGRPRKDSARASPASPATRLATNSKMASKRTFIGGRTSNDFVAFFEPPQPTVPPPDVEDTEMELLDADVLVRSMSSLSVTSPSSS
ncbi:hypothetical protein BT96DRAFT_985461 [Gymnopus androsaceus JB14]|uniref:GIY-YIG domain-containing protein n=1 Tax=Gymnopus androsaceus JB14 TaxID=1447944 RepID=A0A6A4IF12_9AGAR|nr:hypothetical protein BT96DRAFT_985461 [Gymnopus androsaceus JB14]